MPPAVWFKENGTEGSCCRGLSSGFPKSRRNNILEGFADDKDLGKTEEFVALCAVYTTGSAWEVHSGGGNKEGYMRKT